MMSQQSCTKFRKDFHQEKMQNTFFPTDVPEKFSDFLKILPAILYRQYIQNTPPHAMFVMRRKLQRSTVSLFLSWKPLSLLLAHNIFSPLLQPLSALFIQ